MISLTPAPPRSGFRYVLSGRISKNAQWTQVLAFPEDGGSAIDVSDHDLRLTFRHEDTMQPTVSLYSPAEIEATGDAVLSIDAAPSAISGLTGDLSYVADLTSVDGDDNIIHWASGSVFISGRPPTY